MTPPKTLVCLAITILIWALGVRAEMPDTGISGVYEVMVGTNNAEPIIQHFQAFGFRVVDTGNYSDKQSRSLYGVDTSLTAYRLQNGDVDSHGLLRVLEWEHLKGPGVGYAPAETVGQRMAVMRTRDIFRLYDVFSDARLESGEPWLPLEPVYDDLYDMTETKKLNVVNRRVGVRETAIYGEMFNHVFFQRYGYSIPGYGTIGDHSPLQSSEFTHHDFIVKGRLEEVAAYYVQVLGLKAENEPVLDGEWQDGPRRVFQMEPGESHWYQGFVSPNNISGKLKLFSSRDPDHVRDRSADQRIGHGGITLHSFWTPKLDEVHRLATTHGLNPSDIYKNEFGELSFVFTGPDGVNWQIISKRKTRSKPVTKLDIQRVDS
jgi:uncharacterized glyoxalase superfamily protein PhnB